MLRVGTDCSGIEAPIQALLQLNIPFSHEFSCEKDKYAIQSIKANYEPKILYTDITTRDHSKLPDIDLYVCGFPCQTFSLMGNGAGMNDPRGNIMFHCIEVIKQKLPKYFILENVKNFKNFNKGKPFNILLEKLEEIGEYTVSWDILNTRDYGIPQNRERIFIIGIRIDIQLKEYETPEKLPMRDLDDFIEDKTIHIRNTSKSLQNNLNKIKDNQVYIVNPFTYFCLIKNTSPTLTTQCHCFFNSKYNRNLTSKECLNLQGFDNFNQIVSNRQMYRQAGNSMSVNVLKVILNELFSCTQD